MKFRKTKHWKYQITEPFHCQTGLLGQTIETEFVHLDSTGELSLKRYYAWDGASGPCPDVKCVMIASLIHDSLYQMMRLDLLDRNYRIFADQELRRLCILNSMPRIWARLVYWGVRVFAGRGVYPKPEEPVYEI